MNIVITTRKKHPVSDEILYRLAQQSYQQWFDAGIKVSWQNRSLAEFSRILQKAAVFLAIDEDDQEVLGMHCFNCYRQQHYAYGFDLAIAPHVKQQGIASKLLEHEKEVFRRHGYQFLSGDTNIEATWSIRWHLKNGYRIKGYIMGRAPYSGSYQFSLQLAPFSWRHPSTWLWNKPLAPITARCCYLFSYTVAHTTHHSNGQLNWIGTVAKRLRDGISR